VNVVADEESTTQANGLMEHRRRNFPTLLIRHLLAHSTLACLWQTQTKTH
jgi:hypothetical protein